jgi:hypothetical protein
MLKALATIVAALVIGLLAPTGGLASAGEEQGPTWRMRAKLPSTVERGDRPTIVVKVSRSDGKPARGKVTVRVTRADGGYTWHRTKRWEGERLRFRPYRLDQRGSYVLKVKYSNHRIAMAEARSFRVVRRD